MWREQAGIDIIGDIQGRYLDYADVQEFLPKFILNVQALQKQIDTLIDKLMPGGNTHE